MNSNKFAELLNNEGWGFLDGSLYCPTCIEGLQAKGFVGAITKESAHALQLSDGFGANCASSECWEYITVEW